jgi:hypothetical protein
MDNRYYGGKIVSYNQYRRTVKLENKSIKEKEIISQWEKLDLLYEDIKTEDGVISYDYNSIATKLGQSVEEVTEFIDEDFHTSLTGRIDIAIQDIDTQIPQEQKSMAARHGIMTYFLTHRNYLLLGTQRRFKKRHLSLESGQFEEGSYMTVLRLLGDILGTTWKGDSELSRLQVFINTVKDKFNNADELERANIKRIMVDFGLVSTMLAFSIMLSNYLDDEEDPAWALIYADYMLFRVTNEQASVSSGLLKQYPQVIANPIIGMERVSDVFKILDVFDSSEIEKGTYQGMTKSWKWVTSNLPIIKEYEKLSEAKRTSDLYKYYNFTKDNPFTLIPTYHLLKEGD